MAIVGGGISGLAAAFRLQELSRERGRPLDLLLLERSSRLGGHVRTEREGELLLEAGPDQFVTHKPAAVDLCRRLGLERELLKLDSGRPTMQVLRDGEPVGVPEGVTILGPSRMRPLLRSPLFSWRGKARIAAESWAPSRTGVDGDESVGSFVRRRFGRELLDRVVEPIVGGIFTADVDRLSVEMTLPPYPKLEQKHGSVLRGLREVREKRKNDRGRARPAFLSVKGGLERLIDRLVSLLPRENIHLHTTVESIAHDGDRFGLAIAGRPRLAVDAVILACPAHVSATMVRSWECDLADGLASLPYADCATVNLLYPRSAVGRRLAGYGFFAPRVEGLPILACSYAHAKFPERAPGDRVLLRTFLGGALHPEVLGQADEELVASAHRCLSRVLQIRDEPLSARAFRHPRAMPQYPVGYRSRLNSILERAKRYPGLFFSGAVVGAVGLPDCIASGERVAAEALELARTPSERAALVS